MKSYDLRLLKTYGLAERGELIALESSSGFLELAVAGGSAQNLLNTKLCLLPSKNRVMMK